MTHDETTVTSLVEAHDDDVGLQAVLDEERGLDLIELKLPRGMEPGWTLDVDRDIAEGEIPVPHSLNTWPGLSLVPGPN